MAEILLGRVKGDPFRYEDFTPEQLAGLRFKYEDFTPEQLAALNGEDGYSPVRGVDYFTADDVQAMIDEIVAKFENGDFGRY